MSARGALIGAGPSYGVAPETRGRSLEELEDDFRAHDADHLVHEALVGVCGG